MKDSMIGLLLSILVLIALTAAFQLITTRPPEVDTSMPLTTMYARYRRYRQHVHTLIAVAVGSLLLFVGVAIACLTE